jgi:hypothetical protein
MNSGKTYEYIKIAALVVGGYYVLKTIGAIGSGVSNVFSEPEIEEGTSQLDCAGLDDLSHEDFTYKAAADQIQEAVWGAPFAAWENDDAIRDGLLIAWTLDDVQKLNCEYGVRGANDAMSATYNLAQTVLNFLDNDLRQEVNNTYQERGIDFAW